MRTFEEPALMNHIKTFGVVADTKYGNKEGRTCGFEGTVGLLRGSTTTTRIRYMVSSLIAYPLHG